MDLCVLASISEQHSQSHIDIWLRFKHEFIKQPVPANAARDFEKDLTAMGEGSIRPVGIQRMRRRMRTKEPVPTLQPSSRQQRLEADQILIDFPETPRVNRYGLKLLQASEAKALAGKKNGTISRLHTELGLWNADMEPPYIPTLEKAMMYMEILDTTIHNMNLVPAKNVIKSSI